MPAWWRSFLIAFSANIEHDISILIKKLLGDQYFNNEGSDPYLRIRPRAFVSLVSVLLGSYLIGVAPRKLVSEWSALFCKIVMQPLIVVCCMHTRGGHLPARLSVDHLLETQTIKL